MNLIFKKSLTMLFVGVLSSCANGDERVVASDLRKESDHFFSNDLTKDHFVLEFVYTDPQQKKEEYTHFDILSGNLHLSIYDRSGQPIFEHRWSVSDCFSMADNHYMNEDQKIARFLSVVDHFFDESNFSTMADLKLTGLLKSEDSVVAQLITTDPTTIGFSFIKEDFCVMYCRKSQKAILLRALRKDLLRKYNLIE